MKQCFILVEASSSRTTFYSYDSSYKRMLIANGRSLTLDEERISDYVVTQNAQGYYNLLSKNVIINEHLKNSDCDVFYWSIAATGGMRDVEDRYGSQFINNFYSDLIKIFSSTLGTQYFYYESFPTKIHYLTKVETISGYNEGYYAWLSISKYNNLECHGVIDLGGQTGQFANKTSTISEYFGYERNARKINNTAVCYNKQNEYHGEQCRALIQDYLKYSFPQVSTIEVDQHCQINIVSRFYNYFHDVCNLYLPYIKDNNLVIESSILTIMEKSCEHKHNNTEWELTVAQYKEINDEICQYWGAWDNKHAEHTCFSGNYQYMLLNLLGLKDDSTVIVGNFDWSLGFMSAAL